MFLSSGYSETSYVHTFLGITNTFTTVHLWHYPPQALLPNRKNLLLSAFLKNTTMHSYVMYESTITNATDSGLNQRSHLTIWLEI